ncbi:MAG: hypothetical protein HAW67_03695, partial [Endozoicomonadaceae bacterium]|nr:hypothetical protein [Endozoicomonadaceae bacterium]
FSLSDVYKTHENIETEVKKYLLSLMWHNLGKIKPIYKSTLNIDFPEKDIITSIFQAIKIRHDLVHRNGKSTSGEEILITKEGIKKLIDDSSSFVNHINNQLDSIKEDKSIYLDMDDCPF